MNDVTELRRKIDSAHQEAIRALEVIKTYLAQTSAPANVVPGTPRRRQGRHGSFREQVLAVIRDSWASVDEIREKTKLETARIRGVLHAPGLKDSIQTRDTGGKKEYRWGRE